MGNPSSKKPLLLQEQSEIKAIILFLAVSLVVISCTQPNVYNGAKWGMSIDDVQGLYKVRPSNLTSDHLQYKERLDNSWTTYLATYKFDARAGLNEIAISASGMDQERNEEEDIENFEAFFLRTRQVRLLDEAADYSYKAYVGTTHIIYDRVYESPGANIRSQLIRENFTGRPLLRALITFVPEHMTWTSLPSKIKSDVLSNTR